MFEDEEIKNNPFEGPPQENASADAARLNRDSEHYDGDAGLTVQEDDLARSGAVKPQEPNASKAHADVQADLEHELEDTNNKYLRLLADFDNYRKRQAQERESLLKYGAEETLKKIIPVLDNIERAQKSVEELDDPKIIKESYEIVIKNLLETLQKCGLEVIETENKEFDPNLHEAVVQTPASEIPDHTIIGQLQTGYKMGGVVLRPALVNVAVGE